MHPQADSKLIQGDENGRPLNPQNVSSFRRYLPQIMASMAKNLTVASTGLYDGFSSILIPSILGLNQDLNPNETLRISASQASWIASFASVIHPFASLVGWMMSDAIGRKRSIMLAAIPTMFAWILLGFANSYLVITIALMMMGLGLGLKEASSTTYSGEVTETSIRGIILASAGVFACLGQLMTYALGAFLPWRTVAFINTSIPICIFTALIFVPETPIWLLSKDKHKKALKSLQWLRGCVTPDTVHDEYKSLQNYSVRSKTCNECTKQAKQCDHIESARAKLKQLKRKKILKPLLLIAALQFFLQFSAVNTWRPYIIQILNAYTIKWNVSFTTVVLSTLGVVARLCVLPIIKSMGKRKLYLLASAATFIPCFGLCAIGFTLLPYGRTSFHIVPNNSTGSFHIASNNSTESISTELHATDISDSIGNYSYLALVLIMIMQFAYNVGIANIAFIMTGEVFPFKCRAMLVSIVSGIRYIFGAISTKLYYNIELWLTLPGAAAFYGFVSLAGFIVMYLILPETEGRSLEEIELHFSENSRSIRDIKIQRKPNINNV